MTNIPVHSGANHFASNILQFRLISVHTQLFCCYYWKICFVNNFRFPLKKKNTRDIKEGQKKQNTFFFYAKECGYLYEYYDLQTNTLAFTYTRTQADTQRTTLHTKRVQHPAPIYSTFNVSAQISRSKTAEFKGLANRIHAHTCSWKCAMKYSVIIINIETEQEEGIWSCISKGMAWHGMAWRRRWWWQRRHNSIRIKYGTSAVFVRCIQQTNTVKHNNNNNNSV